MHKTLLLRRKLCTKKIRRLESSMEALEKFLQVGETRTWTNKEEEGEERGAVHLCWDFWRATGCCITDCGEQQQQSQAASLLVAR
jgi:hypothetical protein